MQKQVDAVLVCCKNYDFIMNYHYVKNDYLTEILIGAYQDYLFATDANDAKAISMAVQLDHVIQVYLTTKHFYQMVQKHYQQELSKSFDDITDMIALYHDYIREEMMTISSAKWI